MSSAPTKSAAAFRTISEVAEVMDIQQHVLRFWESKFSQINPMKRGGGRRYYRPEDVEVIEVIRKLLHEDGYTIKGAQKYLRENGLKNVLQELNGTDEAESEETLSEKGESDYNAQILSIAKKSNLASLDEKETLNSLKDLRHRLERIKLQLKVD